MPFASFDLLVGAPEALRSTSRINKAKLIMGVVEQFDDISIDELAEGTCTIIIIR